MTGEQDLYELAARVGIDHDFISKTGETVTSPDIVIRAILARMGIAAEPLLHL